MTFKELEKLLISNGWRYRDARGSHYYYIHDEIKGKITIPRHRRRCKKRNFKLDTKTSRTKRILGGYGMKLVYPACFYEEENGYSVVFPDLPGCITQGNTLEEAMEMAEDAALGWLLMALEDEEELPIPTDIKNVELEYEKGFISLILLDLGVYSDKYSEKKYVKKTLTLPYWLNEIAEKKGVNFSQTLQDALLNITYKK